MVVPSLCHFRAIVWLPLFGYVLRQQVASLCTGLQSSTSCERFCDSAPCVGKKGTVDFSSVIGSRSV